MKHSSLSTRVNTVHIRPNHLWFSLGAIQTVWENPDVQIWDLETVSVQGPVFPRAPLTRLVHGVQEVVLDPLYHLTVTCWQSIPRRQQTWGQSPAYFGMSTRTKSSTWISCVDFLGPQAFPLMTGGHIFVIAEIKDARTFLRIWFCFGVEDFFNEPLCVIAYFVVFKKWPPPFFVALFSKIFKTCPDISLQLLDVRSYLREVAPLPASGESSTCVFRRYSPVAFRVLSVDHSCQKILALPLSSFAILNLCGLEWFLMVLRCGISHSVMLNTVEVRMLAGVGV